MSAGIELIEELKQNLIDLSNYSLMTHTVLTGKDPLQGFKDAQEESLKIFQEKNKKYGGNFFLEGMENAFNDIRRKYLRIQVMMKEIANGR